MRLANLCRTRALTIVKLYRWVLFNFFVGNGDAHLKNLSFAHAPGGIALLPHYDLLSTVIYEPLGKHLDAELSQAIGNAKYYGEVRRSDLLRFAQELGIRQPSAEKEIERMSEKVIRYSDELIHEVEALEPYDAKPGELRMLRKIQNLAIDEFSKQIQKKQKN